MGAPRLTFLGLVLALAACGGDEEKAPGAKPAGGPEGAAAFIRCFDEPGYSAARPKPREESVFAFQAKNKGYEVTPVNVAEKGMLTPDAFLVFFQSEAKAREAMKELEATSVGEVEPVQSGAAVIGYVGAAERKRLGKSVGGCLG